MATKKLDLNKLKEEIDKEKQNRLGVPSELGETVGRGISPRDVFLTGLLQARETGADTPSIALIKTVENKTNEKHGGIKKHVINETTTTPVQRPESVDMSLDRDEKLFRDLEEKRKQTLAESIGAFQGTTPTAPKSPLINYNGQQFLTSAPANALTGVPMQLNEAALVESVKNVVNNYLTENLGTVFEEAIKGTIIEMYAVERIKEVLSENRDLIKSVVIETIREIQAKNKAKAQS
jgi:hypothetical protein